MTDINALTRQPEEIDYSAPSQYRFSIIQLPKEQFFTTACNIPGVNMGDAIFPTPFKDIPILPDKVTFENLEITFLVDEKLQNYQELFRWIMAIGFPEDRAQFKSFRQENVGQFPTSQSKINAPSDTPKPRTPDLSEITHISFFNLYFLLSSASNVSSSLAFLTIISLVILSAS